MFSGHLVFELSSTKQTNQNWKVKFEKIIKALIEGVLGNGTSYSRKILENTAEKSGKTMFFISKIYSQISRIFGYSAWMKFGYFWKSCHLSFCLLVGFLFRLTKEILSFGWDCHKSTYMGCCGWCGWCGWRLFRNGPYFFNHSSGK